MGTGLLDKFLFQGLSEGVELTLPYRINVYTNVGKSNGTGDPKTSWNQMYGIAISNVGGTGIRADMHYSHFDSSYARGKYESLSLTREVLNSLRLGLQAGQQTFISPVTSQTRARFVNGNLDWSFAARYFLDFGVTVYRGHSQNYTQTFFTLGYRFGR